MARQAWCIVDDPNITQEMLDAAVWTFAKKAKDNADVSTVGTTLQNNGGGHYILANSSFNDDILFQATVNGQIFEGVFSDFFPRKDFIYCDGWSGDVDPVLVINDHHGEDMIEEYHEKYCVQYKTPDGNISMLGYWSTYGGWEQRIRLGEVCPPGSILCFCPDNSMPLGVSDADMYIPGRMLVVNPQTPGVDQSPIKLNIGSMPLRYGSGLKHCFSANGVMVPLNLLPHLQGIGSGGSVTPEQLLALTEAIGMLTSQMYNAGTISNPYNVRNGDPITIFVNTDYTNMQFNMGVEWAPFLNEADAEVWFTAVTAPGATPAISVQASISNPDTGLVLLSMTSAQTNIKPKDYYWQMMIRRAVTAGDPPVTTVARRMTMEGKLYAKPTFKA